MMIYRNRYLARRAARENEVVVKVEGGYMIISEWEYRSWKGSGN